MHLLFLKPTKNPKQRLWGFSGEGCLRPFSGLGVFMFLVGAEGSFVLLSGWVLITYYFIIDTSNVYPEGPTKIYKLGLLS